MARVLGVSPSGDYAWRTRERSAREASDVAAERARASDSPTQRWDLVRGAPRIHAERAAEGVPVSRKRVARVMREAGLAGGSRRKGPRTTRRTPQARPAPDLVERRFEADAPDRRWVADIPYVPSAAGFVSLAIVLDVFSRRVVGWAMAHPLRTELVLDALDMALGQRRRTSVIHHSDQRCQSTSLAFGERCRQWGVAPSMGSVGDCYDNAMAESFFAALECELPDRTRLDDHRQTQRESSPTSRVGITRTAVTKAWASRHRSTSKRPTRKLHETQSINCPLKWINSTLVLGPRLARGIAPCRKSPTTPVPGACA